MSLIALNPAQTKEYTLRQDTSEDKTVFTVGLIDSITRSYIDDKHMELRQDKLEDIAIHDKYLNFVRFGLKGWKNFKDAEGKEISFLSEERDFSRIGKRTVVSDSCISRLDLTWIIEIGLQIVNINTMSEEHLKKLIMAWEVYNDPSILSLDPQANEKLRYEYGERVEDVTIEEAQNAYHEYRDVVLFMEDWHNGLLTVSYNDYFTLPALLIDLRRIHSTLRKIKDARSDNNN